MFCAFDLSAQNLIPNGDLEDTIPKNFDLKFAAEWDSPTNATPDYYTEYHNNLNNRGVPYNLNGFQQPKSGIAYVGFLVFSKPNPDFREYLQNQLVRELKKDSVYCFQVYVNLADSFTYATRNTLGVYFTDKMVDTNSVLYLGYVPNLILDSNYIEEKQSWIKMHSNYKAAGGEKYLLIGNFSNDSSIDTMALTGGSQLYYQATYLYFDDFYLGSCDSLPQDTSIGLIERKLKFKEAKVFPNPSTAQFNIEVKKADAYTLEVMDHSGRAVISDSFNGSTTQLNLAGFSEGVYFLRIISDRRAYYQKIILQD